MTRRTALLLLLLLTTLQLGLAAGSMLGDSATADEPAHIAAGWLKLVHGRLDFFREQQPLMNAFSALPLLLTGHHFPSPPLEESNHWAAGSDYLFRSGYDSQRLLVLARLPTIALFAALAWVGYAFVARETGDRRWGLAAFALIAFCPNLLAHGRLATVDMAATFFCFLSAVLLVRLLETPAVATALAFGVATAAAILSKTSALILIPYIALVIAVAVVFKRIPSSRRKLALALAAAGAAGVVVIEIVILRLAAEGYMARQFPELRGPLVRLTLPFREIARNVDLIGVWYSGSPFKVQYLLGRFSENSWWHYYPVALFLKMTIPALVISAGGIVLLLRRRATFGAVSALLFVAIFLGAAMSGHLALGVRYVLPIFPFLYAGAVIVLSRTAGRKTAVAVALLVVWHVAEALAAYPGYIGYFNQTIGGHRQADRYLIDSNLDWGQDLRRLDRWCRGNGVDRIAVAYFGGGDPRSDMTIQVQRVWSMGDPEVPPGGHFAISRHLYRISFWRAVSPRSWGEYLKERGARYVTTVGDSILVYEMEE